MNDYLEFFMVGLSPFIPLIAVLLIERRWLKKEIAEVEKMLGEIK